MRSAAAFIAFLGALAVTGLAARGESLASHRDGRCIARRMQSDFCHGLLPQSPAARPSLHGRVVAATTGDPLRNVRVQATTASQAVPPVFTDANGRFVLFSAVDRSTRILISKPGYLATMAAAPRADDDVQLRMPKAAAISGRITDTLGDPVTGITVTAEILAAAAAGKIVATCQTDDLGDYRLSGLTEGRYLVSVTSLSRGGPQGLGDRRIYYPGVQAIPQPLALGAEEERLAIDFLAPSMNPVDADGTLDRRRTGESSRPAVPPTGAPLPRGVIRVRVVATDGRALPQTTVQLETVRLDEVGSRGRPPVVSDGSGQYEFQGVAAGAYRVVATRAGFMTIEYGQRRPSDVGDTIELRSAETRNVELVLPRSGAIAGRVLDDGGEPVEGASVRALRVRYADGRRRLVETANDAVCVRYAPGCGRLTQRTDDRGMYRIYGLPPDEYIVSVTVGQAVSEGPSADLPGYSTSYFPGTSVPGDAQRVAVDLERTVTGVDVPLLRAATARITGTIVDSAGHPVTQGLILTPSRRSTVLVTSPIEARIDPDGRFEFPNVASGEYVIQANERRGDPYDEGESASQFVTVVDTDVSGVTIRLSSGSVIEGRVTFEGNSLHESFFGIDIQAVPVDMDRTPQNLDGPASARIQRDGAFDMAGLSGPRVLRLTGAPPDVTLKTVRLNGRDVTDTPLLFGTAAQSIAGFEVVLTDRVTEVAGHALDARGRGVAGATVIVFSTDRMSWGEVSRFIASVTSESDGAFTVRSLPPGDYHAAATTQVRPGEWRDPDLLDALIPSATPVTLAEGDMVTATVRAVTRVR